MKCLGLLGSVDDAISGIYPRTINGELKKMSGGNHSAEIRMSCTDAAQLDAWLRAGDWKSMTDHFVMAGRGLIQAGADYVVICGSACNPVLDDVRRTLNVPGIDLGMSLAAKLRAGRYRRVGVLGVRSEREEVMLREKLDGIGLIFPSPGDRAWIDECRADADSAIAIPVDRETKMRMIIASLAERGAKALVVTCPSLHAWIKPDDSALLPYDASVIHAWVSALWALDNGERCAPPCLAVA